MRELPEPTPYTSESITSHLRTIILGKSIEVHQQVGSTNDLVREAGRRGEHEGLVIAAEEQVKGRGRMGRVWSAPPGCCILCSVLLRPRFASQQAFYLTAAASLAIYRACGDLLRVPSPKSQVPSLDGQGSGVGDQESGNQSKIQNPKSKIKWPNDVLIDGRKVAGILCESEFDGEGWDFAVLGFGINANLSPEQLGDLRATATSLSIELGHQVDRAVLLARVLAEFESLYLSLQNGQYGLIHEQWAAALDTIGKRVSVTESDGVVFVGQAIRVDPDGALVLRLGGGGEKRILAGDVGML